MDQPQDAATNMAIDEVLFHTVTKAKSPPTVRLYTWSRPSLSIGYRQSLDEACDEHVCRELGVDVVRRISGGRAVLHQHELTYCVAAQAAGPLLGLSVRKIYDRVTGAIRTALAAMDITVDPPLENPTSPRHDAPRELPCFTVPTGHENLGRRKKARRQRSKAKR